MYFVYIIQSTIITLISIPDYIVKGRDLLRPYTNLIKTLLGGTILRKSSKVLTILLCSILLPILNNSNQVNASTVPQGPIKQLQQVKPAKPDENQSYLSNYIRDDVIKDITISHTEATSGDIVRVEVVFDDNIVENSSWTSITIGHESDEYSDSEYMIRNDDLNHYLSIPITHTMKDGKYIIKGIGSSGKLKTGDRFYLNLSDEDESLENKYFNVNVEKDVKANLTISANEIGENDSVTLRMEFNTPNIIAEYVNVEFLTERGNTVSYSLNKETQTVYTKTIKNSDQSEKGKYDLKTITVYNTENTVSGLKANYITMNANSLTFLGENSDHTKPVIKNAIISKYPETLYDDLEILFELETPEEIKLLNLEIDSSVGITDSVNVHKIDDLNYKANIPSTILELFFDEEECEFKFNISVVDDSFNESDFYTNEDLYYEKINDSEMARPKIIGIYTESEFVRRGEVGTYYIEVERNDNPIVNVSVDFMSTDYLLWWHKVLTEKDIDESRSDAEKIVYKGTFGFTKGYNFTTVIPRRLSAKTSSGHMFYRENRQIPMSFLFSEFEDYSKGTFRVLPELKNTITQIAGSHRFRTAVEISKLSFDTAETAVLVLGTDFPDALAAGPLAYINNAPILLSKTSDLPPATLDELNRLGVKNTIILGGNAVINDTVVNILKAEGISSTRISGTNRFQTAIEVAKIVRNTSGINDKVILTNSDEFADSLSIGSYAAKSKMPILLTRQQSLSKSTEESLIDFGVKEVLIMGGEAAVSTAVELQIKDLGIKVTRISGSNRYLTAMNSAKENFSDASKTIIASGEEFADALAAAPYAAKLNAPIILVRKDRVSETVKDYLVSSSIVDYHVVGGDAAVSESLRVIIGTLRD